uniref:DUF676 domain-containing protein n=1 Tax=Kalanchoe fedtschenkoi TaxID=63787 RepID=A0A7N0VHC7_KALFE
MGDPAVGKSSTATHLIIMVNGIVGSPANWEYAASQFVHRYPQDVVVHCSESNSSLLTFDGVDVMGERLAQEVISEVSGYPNLQKISFIAHSLGGLVARYAIAILYEKDPTLRISQQISNGGRFVSHDACPEKNYDGKVAGLIPMNFISCATPHLGSRGHNQVPMFFGFQTLEKVAYSTSWLLGRTGKHLFLSDNENGSPPLLLQMTKDQEDLKFISALGCFKRRVAYANTSCDHLVGWATSSIRRFNDLPKLQGAPVNKIYPHIVNVETAHTDIKQEEIHAEADDGVLDTDGLEEEMIRGLTKVSWERIDVGFSGFKQWVLGHSTIQVKTPFIHSEGADVIAHMVDNFLM